MRVAVVAPTGRYARNQVAGMIEAGTPLVGGVALGRGGTAMDGLPLYDRIADFPQQPNIALIYTPAEGVRRCGHRVRAGAHRDDHGGRRNMCRCTTRSRRRNARPRGGSSGSSGRTRSAFSCRAAGCLAPSRRAFGSPGRLALIIRSGTLALAMARQLTLAGSIGQRIVADVGGDMVIGRNPSFYATTLADIRVAFRQYKKEIVRLIAQMSLGTGALAVIGGTVVIVGFLTLSVGALVGIQGYNQFSSIGVEALTGFVSAFVNVRLVAPVDRRYRVWPPRSAPAPPRSWAPCASTKRSTRSR